MKTQLDKFDEWLEGIWDQTNRFELPSGVKKYSYKDGRDFERGAWAMVCYVKGQVRHYRRQVRKKATLGGKR